MHTGSIFQSLGGLRRWIGVGWVTLALWLLSIGAVAQTINATAIDLPLCDASAPGMTRGVSLGIAQPYAAPAVLDYAVRLTLASRDVSICSEPWSEVLPGMMPWARNLERGHGFAAFLLAFVVAVGGLYAVTPRRWWERTTLVGVLAVGVLTWLLGFLLLTGFHLAGRQRLLYGTVISLRVPQQAKPEWFDVAGARELESVLAKKRLLAAQNQAVPAPAAAVPAPPITARTEPSGPYRVQHRVNLREAVGTAAKHIEVLNPGETVTYDGALEGDWWRIRNAAGQVGWASSLWLRQPAEK